MVVKKKLKLFELHEGQNLFVNQEFKRGGWPNVTALARHIFALGMAEYLKKSKENNGL